MNTSAATTGAFPLLRVAANPSLAEVFGIGATVLVLVTLLHGFGIGHIIKSYRRVANQLLRRASHPWRASIAFGWTVLLMLILHIADNCVWALMLNRLGLIQTSRDSLYFAANAYTTLGYGSVSLGIGWRELSPIIAISGLFTFGWTTSVMFNIVGHHRELIDELTEEYDRKMQMRSDLLVALNSQRQQEVERARADVIVERKAEAGKSLIQRLNLRLAERMKLHEMRKEATKLAEDTFNQERQAESRIYQPTRTSAKLRSGQETSLNRN